MMASSRSLKRALFAPALFAPRWNSLIIASVLPPLRGEPNMHTTRVMDKDRGAMVLNQNHAARGYVLFF
jgi:hypothetical protein